MHLLQVLLPVDARHVEAAVLAHLGRKGVVQRAGVAVVEDDLGPHVRAVEVGEFLEGGDAGAQRGVPRGESALALVVRQQPQTGVPEVGLLLRQRESTVERALARELPGRNLDEAVVLGQRVRV